MDLIRIDSFAFNPEEFAAMKVEDSEIHIWLSWQEKSDHHTIYFNSEADAQEAFEEAISALNNA